MPALCVVGISLSQGEWLAASGALLLFLANFFAILFAGGITFMILGLGKVALQETQQRYRQRSFVLIILGTLLLTIPLCLTGYQLVTNTIAVNKVTAVVQEWLQGTTDHLLVVAVDGSLVNVSIEGIEPQGSVNELAVQLENELGYPVTVILRIIPAKFEISQGESTP